MAKQEFKNNWVIGMPASAEISAKLTHQDKKQRRERRGSVGAKRHLASDGKIFYRLLWLMMHSTKAES